MIPSFDQWLAENCSPPPEYNLEQYGRYVEGWRASMPWAYRGMSLAYDRWDERRWQDTPDAVKLQEGWRRGIATKAKAIQGGDGKWMIHATPEECADFGLSLPETLEALVFMASQHCLPETKETYDQE